MKFLTLAGAFALLFLTVQTEAAPAPSGTWDVVAVQVDTNATRAQAFFYNDPRLVGRSFTFAGSKITTTASEGGCQVATFASTTGKAGDIFKNAMGMRTDTVPITPADYAIKLTPGQQVPVTMVSCKTGFGAGSPNPLIHMSNGQLLLPWNDGALLVLQQRKAAVRPTASFSCTKAASVTEKTICGSVDLAAFDRSVGVAFKDATKLLQETSPDQLASFRKQQRDWLVKRNQCGVNASCLQKSMADRLEILVNTVAE
jgi:uncharacterized protein YecT (DUF1311 family)